MNAHKLATRPTQLRSRRMIYGWICPRCGKVLAPNVKECTCKPEPKSNANNPFYQVFKTGVCQSTSKLISCPEHPNYDSCHNCPNWLECVPV